MKTKNIPAMITTTAEFLNTIKKYEFLAYDTVMSSLEESIQIVSNHHRDVEITLADNDLNVYGKAKVGLSNINGWVLVAISIMGMQMNWLLTDAA